MCIKGIKRLDDMNDGFLGFVIPDDNIIFIIVTTKSIVFFILFVNKEKNIIKKIKIIV